MPPKWLGAGVLLGASVYPLNQYYLGLALEPKHGITIGGGIAWGAEQSLSPPNYVGQLLGPTEILNTSGSNSTIVAVPAPTIQTSTVFHKSGFLIVGFDINIFQAIFGKVANVGTPPASSPTPASQ